MFFEKFFLIDKIVKLLPSPFMESFLAGDFGNWY